MPAKSDWERAALAQAARADSLATKNDDLEHALNLIVNGAIEWFMDVPASNGSVHRFGIGVAMNAEPSSTVFGRVWPGEKLNRGIVFWLTEFEGEHKYISAYSMDEFSSFPDKLQAKQAEEMATIARKALEQVDAAYERYIKVRTTSQPVM